MLILRADIREHFPGSDSAVFDKVLALQGEVFRDLAGRKTLRFPLNDKYFFVKIHHGVGWWEIIKNLCQLRRPVIGARDEWRAIQHLDELGVATMTVAGFGERGICPSRRQSFLLTDELVNTVSLEDFCRSWPEEPPPAALKRMLIDKVATIAGCLHNNGVNHRDCYICHFLLDTETLRKPFAAERLGLYLIDLHRMQIRSRTPRRWVEKDLAALCFSSMDIALTQRDLFRFMKAYRRRPLRQIIYSERRFWKAIESKALRLYRNPSAD